MRLVDGVDEIDLAGVMDGEDSEIEDIYWDGDGSMRDDIDESGDEIKEDDDVGNVCDLAPTDPFRSLRGLEDWVSLDRRLVDEVEALEYGLGRGGVKVISCSSVAVF